MALESKADGTAETGTSAEVHARGLIERLRRSSLDRSEALGALAASAARVVGDNTGVPPPHLALDERARSAELDQLLSVEGEWLRSASPDNLATYLPAVARAMAAADLTGSRELVTSVALAEVIAALVTVRPPQVSKRPIAVFDPAAGTGSLLLHTVSALRPATSTIFGQDINESMSVIATANALLTGVANATFVHGDALIEDAFPNEVFDLVVTDPPFGQRASSGALSASSWPWISLADRADLSLIFGHIAVSKLRHPASGGGRAVILLPPAALVETNGAPIREEWLEQDLVEAIVALPEGLSSKTATRLFAVVLNNAKPNAWVGKIQVVDLRGSYVDSSTRQPERRRISDAGMAELRKSMQKPKPSALARVVSLDHFRFDSIDVVHHAKFRTSHGAGDRATLHVFVPRSRSLTGWSEDRYGGFTLPDVTFGDAPSQVRFDISTVFPDSAEREAPAEVRRLGWPHTRLACLAVDVGYVRSARAADRDIELAAVPADASYLAVPVEPHLDATVVEALGAPPDGRFFFLVQSETAHNVNFGFVAAWLNAPAGRATRRAGLMRVGAPGGSGAVASVRSVSRSQVIRFLDEVLVPVPSAAVQRDIAIANNSVAAAAQAVAAAARGLWQDPETHRGILQRMKALNEPEGLDEWARRLPYPLAGALWVYETEKHAPLRAKEHLLRFWEATAEFLGVFLLSVIDGDEVLRTSEIASLREVFGANRLSLDISTFGTWAAIATRLSATFRKNLNSETPDTADKVLQMFGDPPIGVLGSLLSPDVGTLLGRVNALRNEWHGHAGATTETQARKQVEELVEYTNALRDLHSSVWEVYRLVRAGSMALRQGVYNVEVELARGPITPFRKRHISVRDPMDEGQLYLTVLEGDRAVRVNELVVFRAAPSTASYTCYFYNRRQDSEVRMITYQYADEGAVVERVPSVSALLADFRGENGSV